MFEVYFVDTNPLLIKAWNSMFSNYREVNIIEGDIFQFAENCIVSPSNSYGFMDGGIDIQFINFFGSSIQRIVREEILLNSNGLLPVGLSRIVRTNHKKIPYLIIAPTMVTPEYVEENNAYRAFRAVLRIAQKNDRHINKLYCPGLATGIGGVSEEDAAQQMLEAYRNFKESLHN